MNRLGRGSAARDQVFQPGLHHTRPRRIVRRDVVDLVRIVAEIVQLGKRQIDVLPSINGDSDQGRPPAREIRVERFEVQRSRMVHRIVVADSERPAVESGRHSESEQAEHGRH